MKKKLSGAGCQFNVLESPPLLLTLRNLRL